MVSRHSIDRCWASSKTNSTLRWPRSKRRLRRIRSTVPIPIAPQLWATRFIRSSEWMPWRTASRTDVPRLLRFAADAFLFPSLYEGLGIALIEAQAAALPSVISDLVPEEADIIPPLIHRLSLAQPAAVWASELLAVKKRCRPLSDVEELNAMEASTFKVENKGD